MGMDPIPSETPAKSKRRGFCCTELKPKTALMRRRVKPYSQHSTHARLYPAPGTDCQGSTSDLGDPSQNAPFSLFPNPLSPEHAMVHVSGLTDETTPIRVLASDGRVVWQGTGIKMCPGVIGYPIRESISPGTYFIQVGYTSPSGNIALMVW